jgi:hypothetical protein
MYVKDYKHVITEVAFQLMGDITMVISPTTPSSTTNPV